MHCQSALEAVTRRAGAVADRHTGVAVLHGSPAGELAACVTAAGTWVCATSPDTMRGRMRM